MKLSVVIPALDEAEGIVDSVESARGDDVEILVVDGGSSDGTPDKARAAGATVKQSPPGRARQLGVGAEATRGEAVLFLHADTLLPAGWPASVRRALADPTVAGGAFRFGFSGRGAGLRAVEWGARLRCALLRLPYGDQAIFVRRRVLDEMGGMPQAPLMEDLDLVAEIKRRGRLVLLPSSVSTSPRRYRERGLVRTVARNFVAALGRLLGVERDRIAAWYRR